MENVSALSRLTDQPALDGMAEPLSRAVRGAYESAGEAGRQAKNALHGVWLGHPLHPALVAVPLGAWTTAVSLDVAAAASNDRGWRARPTSRSPSASSGRWDPRSPA